MTRNIINHNFSRWICRAFLARIILAHLRHTGSGI